jgi:hypothetical protein
MSSWLWFSRWVHISNAELGTYNPQLVSSCMFTVGYTWFNEEGILRPRLAFRAGSVQGASSRVRIDIAVLRVSRAR